MQCPNCHFENMPGNRDCLRCGTSLGLAQAMVSVHPKRASSWVKRLRRWIPLRGLGQRFAEQFTGWRATLIRSIACNGGLDQIRLGSLPRMIVPGWAHAYEGSPRRGRWFFIPWLLTLTVGLLTFGSALAFGVLGLMVAIHVSSMVDVLCHFDRATWPRRALPLAAGATACAALYGSMFFAATRYIDSRQWLINGPVLNSGDVVLFSPRAYESTGPQPGDVVLFRTAGANVPRHDRPYPGGYLDLRNGQWIDRVIAGPGSTVRWSKGSLSVDGEPTPLRPLRSDLLPDELDLQVPENSYCIIPSANAFLRRQDPLVVWQQQSIVPRSRIEGRAIVRHYPFWRYWWLR